MRQFLWGVFTAYALTAVLSGTAMYRAMPALNLFGGAYVAVTWPVAMFCAASQIPGCTVLPPSGSMLASMFFTFQD